MVLELSIKFGSNICDSHCDQHTYAPDIHLMTSRELTSGFDFWSAGHLRMAVVHIPINVSPDICIQSRVIDIFPKFKMAAAAILDFQFMWIWPFRRVDRWYLCSVPNLVQISVIVTEINTHIMLQTINFRFRLLVTWSSLRRRDASSHIIWCKISLSSPVIYIFSKFKMAAAAILNFGKMCVHDYMPQQYCDCTSRLVR